MKLIDYVDVLRSKNAGPFYFTIDIFCKDEKKYRNFKKQNPITVEYIAEAYDVDPELVQTVYVDKAQGFKVTVPRKYSSGSAFDTDIYGAQQHAPLMNLEIKDVD